MTKTASGSLLLELAASCGDCCKYLELFQQQRAAAVREAKEMGWKFSKGEWLCPDCQETK